MGTPIEDLRSRGWTVIKVDGVRYEVRLDDPYGEETPVLTLDNVERLLNADTPEARPLPLNRIVVDGIEIPASKIQAGSMYHDIDKSTLTVTLADVRTVETVYRHMEDR